MKTFDTTPKPAFLRALKSQSWKEAGAVAELVDNSLGSGRGNASIVEIIHDTTARTLTVVDNGQGMEALGRLFQLGNTIGRSPGDIGNYGSGGTMAIIWLAKSVEVWTLRDGKVSHDKIDWDEEMLAERFPTVSDEWEPLTLATAPAALVEFGHGTLIRMQIARERKIVPSNIRRDLAQIYAPAVRNGKSIIWKSVTKGQVGEDIALSDPMPLLDAASVRHFDITIEIDGQHLGVHGAIGLVHDLPLSKSNVLIGYGNRVITRTRECYSSRDALERFDGTGVTGWLDLQEGWQPYLSTTKDSISDQRAWDALMNFIFAEIKPLLERADREKLDIQFTELAMMLEANLNQPWDKSISVRYNAGPPPGDLPGTTNEGSGTKRPRDAEQTDKGEHEKDIASICSITVTKQPEALMNGALCRATALSDRTRDEIVVEVNEEHWLIQEALKQRPQNRAAFNLTVTAEISREIAGQDGLIARMFPRPLARKLALIDDHKERGRQIARLLIDRANPPLEPSEGVA